MMMQALEIYRGQFRSSERLQKPYVMLGFNVFAADTDAEAQLLATSQQQSFINLRRGRPTQLPPPRADYAATLAPHETAQLEQILSCSAIGAADTVRQGIADFVARTGADELMITGQIFDHAARVHSYEIIAAVRTAMS
jgi:alkanesulfonate monooxygenase SsuD/methylene tetrahydromethanopterin reductase-like flavin-dependent oxidoreductase (luciferase family)